MKQSKKSASSKDVKNPPSPLREYQKIHFRNYDSAVLILPKDFGKNRTSNFNS